MMSVVLPWIKARLVEAGDDASARPMSFHYQRPPSVRLQPPDPHAYCRTHRDAEYGHQLGELNFWLPLTDPELTETTLWVESEPGAADYRALRVRRGEIAAFHGTLCRHHVPPNGSACTRVSLDFRVGVGDFFDSEWKLSEAKAQHTRRTIVVSPRGVEGSP